jgi:Tol biopolymer transport system component
VAELEGGTPRPLARPDYRFEPASLVAWSIDGDVVALQVASEEATEGTTATVAVALQTSCLESEKACSHKHSDGLPRFPLEWHHTTFPQWTYSCRIVYVCGDESADANLCVSFCDGSSVRQVTYHRAWDERPSWSPDGSQIAFDSDFGGEEHPDGFVQRSVFVCNADGSDLTMISGSLHAYGPSWAPDGSRIVFQSDGSGGCGLSVRNQQGVVTEILNHPGGTCPGSSAWSPDSEWLAFLGGAEPDDADAPYIALFVARPDGRQLRELARFDLQSEINMAENLAWAPDGRHMAVCAASADGARQCYIADARGEEDLQPIRARSGIPESWFPYYWPQWHGQEWPPVLPTQ